jgi:hypothetical protein
MVVPSADVIPPLVRRQAGTVQPIGKDQKPCAIGTVSFIPSRHGGYVLAAAVEEELLILELIPTSHRASLCVWSINIVQDTNNESQVLSAVRHFGHKV